jgi:tRNA(Arg) A34 adenosine deaminase TadA
MELDHEKYIRLAMEEAETAVKEGNAPFGVVVADKNGVVVGKDHDRVKELMDPTAHGEVNIIRKLCKELNTLNLREYIFYTTSEPCPTCLTSCIKAKVANIYYGAETEASASLPIKASELAAKSLKYPIKVVGGIIGAECLEQRNRLLK